MPIKTTTGQQVSAAAASAVTVATNTTSATSASITNASYTNEISERTQENEKQTKPYSEVKGN